MRAIINGLRYDTETAVAVGSVTHRMKAFPTSDGWKATLYKTPRAHRFFLAGEGGTMTRWAGRERILPLTIVEARDWASDHLDAKALEEHFVIEDA